jgi:hypothetical protein
MLDFMIAMVALMAADNEKSQLDQWQ